MNTAVLHTLGKPPRFAQFPDPTPAADEVLVHVHAASLKPVDRQMAAGSHYASPRDLPAVCGIDGVGHLDNGTRVFFGGPRRPYGAMAQRTVVRRAQCFSLLDAVPDDIAAALPNPGVSAWLSLTWRAKLVPGETVLILGATGVTGKLAVQIAKLLGAARVIAAGRNQQALAALLKLGADSTIHLADPNQDLAKAFGKAAGEAGFQVVIDYLWGRPTEALLAALTRTQFIAAGKETRLVQVGESAGPAINLPAATLHSTALTILGTSGIPAPDVLTDAFQKVMSYAASGKLTIETQVHPLAEIEQVWERASSGPRIVIVP
jgi:NADPH:quinone reductase-like Zn-dependent oxidoreductase